MTGYFVALRPGLQQKDRSFVARYATVSGVLPGESSGMR